MSRILFITGSDTNQFNLAQSCVESIKQQVKQFEYDIAFLDLGCNSHELDLISHKVKHLKKVEWEFGITNNIPELECRKGQICRPFLRDYFPNYDIYIWIDADAWIQDGSCIDMYVKGAEKRGVAIVAEMDRSSKFFHGALALYLQSMHQLYSNVYDTNLANQLYHMVNLNAGVFAFSKESFVWDAWKSALEYSIRTFLHKNPPPQVVVSAFGLIDQMALNLALRSQQNISQVEILPCYCNWTCHLATPSFDEEKNLFVEPYLPNETIGIIHLTNPWGGTVGELNEPFRSETQKFASINSGKDFYKIVNLLTIKGDQIVKSLFATLDKQ